MEQIDYYYLKTTFQKSIESAIYYNNLPAPQETPYVNKYKAIQILKALKPTVFSFIPSIILGDIYSDVDQNSDSLRSYQKALQIFEASSEIKGFPVDKYYLQLQDIYNLLGLNYINIDKNDEGIGMLAKAMSIYEGFKEFEPSNIYQNRCTPQKNANFAYYYEGGVNTKMIQASHTLTLFYLAQAYAKLGFKAKSAQYCGNTLKRQYASKSYQLKDFCLNLMSMADYYRNNYFFAQAQYLLLVGLRVLPEQGKNRLRASLVMALGDNLKQLLQYSCISLVNGNNQQLQTDNVISRNFLEFEGSGVVFPKITLGRNEEECKSIFRRSNTQYKKALETYVLDGYVTEHIEILFSQSKLYKSLCIIDQSAQRRIKMAERRQQIFQPILKQLNPKAYIHTWQKVLVQLSQIMNQVFDMKCQFPSSNKINQMNQAGFKAIQYLSMIQKNLLDLKDVQKNQAYYQSIVNAKFNIAKTYSRLMKAEPKQRVEFLKKALAGYKDLQNFINIIRTTTPFKDSFKKQETLTFQMVQMLPSKIDRVNNGLNDL